VNHHDASIQILFFERKLNIAVAAAADDRRAAAARYLIAAALNYENNEASFKGRQTRKTSSSQWRHAGRTELYRSRR